MAREALRRNVRCCNIFAVVIFAFQCQETTPTTSFACEIPVRGSFSQLNFRVDCSALEKRENFPLYSILRSFQRARSIHAYIIQWNFKLVTSANLIQFDKAKACLVCLNSRSLSVHHSNMQQKQGVHSSYSKSSHHNYATKYNCHS